MMQKIYSMPYRDAQHFQLLMHKQSAKFNASGKYNKFAVNMSLPVIEFTDATAEIVPGAHEGGVKFDMLVGYEMFKFYAEIDHKLVNKIAD